jgi:hypothetical protein
MTVSDLRARPRTGPAVHRRSGSRRPRRWFIVAVGALVAGTTAAVAVAVSGGHSSTPLPACTVTSPVTKDVYALSPDQAQDAAIIAAVAFHRNLPDHAVTVALAAALQESKLQNLPFGDRDSVGLFQQRPSEGWGTRAQLLDPIYAATAFYGGLTKVAGWQTMAVTEAAQAVQHSGAPTAYAAWEDEARAMAVALTGEEPAGFSCQLPDFGGPAPAPTAFGQALNSEMGQNLIGASVVTKTGWRVASWAVAHAYAYHISRVTFAGWVWRDSSGKWTHAGSSAEAVTVAAG